MKKTNEYNGRRSECVLLFQYCCRCPCCLFHRSFKQNSQARILPKKSSIIYEVWIDASDEVNHVFRREFLYIILGSNWTLFDAFHYFHALEMFTSESWICNLKLPVQRRIQHSFSNWNVIFPAFLDHLLYSVMNFWISQCLIFGLRNSEATLANCNFILLDATCMRSHWKWTSLCANLVIVPKCFLIFHTEIQHTLSHVGNNSWNQ
jgi:hypothetical protein